MMYAAVAELALLHDQLAGGECALRQSLPPRSWATSSFLSAVIVDSGRGSVRHRLHGDARQPARQPRRRAKLLGRRMTPRGAFMRTKYSS